MSELDNNVNFQSLKDDWEKCKSVIMALKFPNKWEYKAGINCGELSYYFEYVTGIYSFNVTPPNIYVYNDKNHGMYFCIESINLNEFKTQVMKTHPGLKWPGEKTL